MSFKKYLKEAEDPIQNPSNSDESASKYNKENEDEIGTLWVVTKAQNNSELIDILFKSSVKGMMVQGKGGLELDDIIVITKDYNKAKMIAQHQLSTDVVSIIDKE